MRVILQKSSVYSTLIPTVELSIAVARPEIAGSYDSWIRPIAVMRAKMSNDDAAQPILKITDFIQITMVVTAVLIFSRLPI